MSLVEKLQSKIDKYSKINAEITMIVIEFLISIQHIIIDMNTDDQLYLKGVDADNVPIIDREPYSPFTVYIKSQKGQPTNRVTLRDTGDFHAGFIVKKETDRIVVTSTDDKTFELTMRYGDRIFGLIPDNRLEISNEYLKPHITEMLK